MKESKALMIEGVNKIIAQRLLTSQGVYLPSVGSIIVKLKSAEVSGKSITPPLKSLDFSSKEQGVSIIDLIKESAECNRKQAQELYESYLTGVRTKDGVEIAGVATLIGKSFRVYKEFAAQLNPQGAAKRELPKSGAKSKRNRTTLIAIVGGVAAVVLVFALFNIFSKDEPEQLQPVAEQVAEVREEPKVEAPKPVAKRATYGVVYGVYSQPSNVEPAKSAAAKLMSGVTVTTHPYSKGRTAIVIFESENRREAQRFLNRHYNTIPDSWVHEFK